MEKNQYNLCMEVLKRLNAAGVLNQLILIGSWCLPFYKEYFADAGYLPALRTRDIDFLIASPGKVQGKTDIPELLKDLGFVVGFKGSKGYIRLEHPLLIVEFLVPEKGRGQDEPVKIPQLAINAQSLRFLNLITEDTIEIESDGLNLRLPHPIRYALHKIIVSQRRSKPEKAIKDMEAGIGVLKALISQGQQNEIRKVYNSLPTKWKNKIRNGIEKSQEQPILDILNPA